VNDDSRIVRICELLLHHPEEEACRQLTARIERKHPGAVQGGALPEVLARLMASDYVARELANQIEPPPPDDSGPGRSARLLFLSALPNEMSAVRIHREARDILEALKLSSKRKKLLLRDRGAVRITEIHRHILDFEPDIIHFSGHGYQGGILLEDQKGGMVPVAAGELAELFGILDQKIRCVVLNACETGLNAEPLAEKIGVVVVRDGSVHDSAAIVFSPSFYEGLAQGLTPRKAFELACWQVKMQTLFGESELPRLVGASLDTPFILT
jgi:CHAT domain-containing protein